jgi:hypothetical protein
MRSDWPDPGHSDPPAELCDGDPAHPARPREERLAPSRRQPERVVALRVDLRRSVHQSAPFGQDLVAGCVLPALLIRSYSGSPLRAASASALPVARSLRSSSTDAAASTPSAGAEPDCRLPFGLVVGVRFGPLAWHSLSGDVLRAVRERQKIGTRIAADLLKQGKYLQYKQDDYPAPRQDERGRWQEEKRPWKARSHPDEWITAQHGFDDALKIRTVKVVRIPRGHHNELDLATNNVQDMSLVRKREIEFFLSTYNLWRKQ